MGIKATGIDVIVILAYLAVMLAIGFMSKKRANSSSEQYLVAGRNLGFWMFFPCMSAVVLGGASTMGATKLGYVGGFGLSWFLVWQGLGVMALGFFMSKKLVRLKITTVGELFSLRFGKFARLFSAVIMSIFTSMLAVIQIIAVGALLSALLGWDMTFAMLVGGGIAILYSFIGGMVAITFTDFIQWAIMTVGVFLIFLPMAFIKAGGFEGLATLPPAHLNFMSGGFLDEILPKFIMFFLGISIDQSVWQRVFTGKNSKIAYAGTIASGVYSLVYGLACVFLGMCAFLILPTLDSPQQAFGLLAVEILPPGVLGIVIAAVMSAIMSTMSGPILATTTLVLKDMILPVKDLNEKQKMLTTRVLMFSISAACMVCALFFGDIVVALDVAYAILSGGLFVPIICALFWKRATTKACVASMIVSTVVIIAGMAIYGISSYLPILYGFLTSLVVMPIVTMLTTAQTENKIEEILAAAGADE